ncbi:hypothetical protein HRG_001490 [Hirsutella rhossiliensis]|uniref:Uncharacterized protein n=1 Tax=Hirsutella rhossiliensis TaxID=111463 RepID=A0A9P8N757_9HYPO|nr:uncharacterized protein HRG_01490 [Hirsutella rhossiliensis]KAH0968848.1 hypothetical protein HRG_01490 [Hirsutella rhossiliensis]
MKLNLYAVAAAAMASTALALPVENGAETHAGDLTVNELMHMDMHKRDDKDGGDDGSQSGGDFSNDKGAADRGASFFGNGHSGRESQGVTTDADGNIKNDKREVDQTEPDEDMPKANEDMKKSGGGDALGDVLGSLGNLLGGGGKKKGKADMEKPSKDKSGAISMSTGSPMRWKKPSKAKPGAIPMSSGSPRIKEPEPELTDLKNNYHHGNKTGPRKAPAS